MYRILYSLDGIRYDHLIFKYPKSRDKWIQVLKARGAVILEENIDDKSKRDEEIDRKSRGVS